MKVFFFVLFWCFFSFLHAKSKEQEIMHKLETLFHPERKTKSPPSLDKKAEKALETLKLRNKKVNAYTSVGSERTLDPIKTCGYEGGNIPLCKEGEFPRNIDYHLYIPEDFEKNIKKGNYPPVVFEIYGGGVPEPFYVSHFLAEAGCLVVVLVDENIENGKVKNMPILKENEEELFNKGLITASNYTNFPNLLFKDIKRVMNYLKDEHNQRRYIFPETSLFLTGSSFGGYTTLLAATDQNPETNLSEIFKGFIVDMGVYDYAQVGLDQKIEFPGRIKDIYDFDYKERKTEDVNQRTYFFKDNYLANEKYNEEISPLYHLGKLKNPVLGLHGMKDIRVVPRHLTKLYDEAKKSDKTSLLRIQFYQTAQHNSPTSEEEKKDKLERQIAFIQDVIVYGPKLNKYPSVSSEWGLKEPKAISERVIEKFRTAVSRTKKTVADRNLFMSYIYLGDKDKVKEVIDSLKASKKQDTTEIRRNFINQLYPNPEKPEEKILPLEMAILKKGDDIINYLIEKGADPSGKDETGNTSLHRFVEKNDFVKLESILKQKQIVEVLLQPKNIKNNSGDTPLHLAAKKGEKEIITSLLMLGRELLLKEDNLENKDRLTALDLAIEYNFSNIKKLKLDMDDDDIVYSLLKIFSNDKQALEILLNHNNIDLLLDKNEIQKRHVSVILRLAKKYENKNIINTILNNEKAWKNLFDKVNFDNDLLYWSVKKGYLDFVKLILSNNEMLGYASKGKGKREYAKWLFKEATAQKDANIIQVLLANKTIQELFLDDSIIRGTNGLTPLYDFVNNGKANLVKVFWDNEDVRTRFLNKGYIKGRTGTLLHVAASYGYTDIIEMLLSHKDARDIFLSEHNNQDKNVGTPLHYAAKYGKSETVYFLLKNKDTRKLVLNEFLAYKDENSPLYLAFAGGHKNAVHVLLNDKGAREIFLNPKNIKSFLKSDDSGKNKEGLTLFQFVVEGGDKEAMDLLFKNKVAMAFFLKKDNIVDTFGHTPLYWAVNFGKRDIVKMLIDNVDVRKILLEEAYLDADIDGNTLLHLAALQDDTDIVQLLFNDTEAAKSLLKKDKLKNNKGETPLFKSILERGYKTASFFIEKGFEINTPDKNGTTPLMKAIQIKNNKVVALLLKQKEVEINKADKKGDTALHYAAYINNVKGTNLLLESKADKTIKDKESKTPLMIAKERKSQEVEKILN